MNGPVHTPAGALADSDIARLRLIRTYRALRIATVVAAVMLLAAIVRQIRGPVGWLSSISGYYYSNAQTVFVASLAAIGVSLLSIFGVSDVEDTLLNIAGSAAPVVAFVPTNPLDNDRYEPYIGLVRTSMWAYLAGAVVSVVVMTLAARDEIRAGWHPAPTRRWFLGGLAASAIPAVVFLVLGFTAGAAGLPHLHLAAAITLFGAVGVVVAGQALRNLRTLGRTLRLLVAVLATLAGLLLVFAASPGAWTIIGVALGAVGLLVGWRARRDFAAVGLSTGWVGCYALIALTMAVSPVGILILDHHHPIRHEVFIIEVIELACFGLFWALQTVEHWNEAGRKPESTGLNVP